MASEEGEEDKRAQLLLHPGEMGKTYFPTQIVVVRIVSLLLVKPYFLQEPDDITASNGEDILLECEVGGDPRPTVLWHREDGTLPHGRTSIQNGQLSIQDVTPKDEGVYVCEAQNTVGTISVSASVAVHGKTEKKAVKTILSNVCFVMQHIPISLSSPKISAWA